jgi:hypothetical protein
MPEQKGRAVDPSRPESLPVKRRRTRTEKEFLSIYKLNLIFIKTKCMTSKAVFTIEKRRKLAFLTADHTCRKNRNGEQAAAGYMGRLQGESGRAEDPSLPTAGRKGLAEAGPPGKRPHGNESGWLQK